MQVSPHVGHPDRKAHECAPAPDPGSPQLSWQPVVAATACATAPASTSDRTDRLVLADGYDLGGYNPITGHGEAGESKIYDGLLRLSGGDGMPTFEPARRGNADRQC